MRPMQDLPESMFGWTKLNDEIGGFSLEKHDMPKPEHGEVLIKTHSTSICGTDVHIWKWDDWAKENVPLGTITGHETCGVIVGLGDGVESHSIGDKVRSECSI